MDIQPTVINDVRHYETTFIVVPDLDEAEYPNVISKFNGLIQQNGGSIINQEIWGMKKLAYEIRKPISGQRVNTGYFVFTEFTSEPNVPSELERVYDIDEQIIRHLTVKLNKYAVEWNEKRRSRLKNKASQVKEASAS